MTAVEKNQHELLLKTWSGYKYKQHLAETRMIDQMMNSQQRALNQLKSVSKELYMEAIQVNKNLKKLLFNDLYANIFLFTAERSQSSPIYCYRT